METCEKCGHKKEVYNGAWCPRCEKPKKVKISTLNLLQCLRYIETTYNNKGYEDRVWDNLSDENRLKNDTSFMWYPPEETEEGLAEYITDPKLLEKCKQGLRDENLLAKTFNIDEKGILFKVSW